MNKKTMLNRIMAFALACGLFVSTPASVYAEELNGLEPIMEITAEDVPTVGGGNEISTSDAEDKSETDAADSDADQISTDDSISDASNEDKEINTDDARAGVVKLTDDADEAEDDSDDECDHSDFRYESNGDGTHNKVCTECGESEIEACEYDENGFCKKCGYENLKKEITISDENGLVKITGTKEALNGAVKVTAEEITIEDDEYAKMSEALDEQMASESDSKTVVDFAAYDINLFNGAGEIVEPNGEVSVVFTNLPVEGLDDYTCETGVYHYEDESVNKMSDVSSSNDVVEMTTTHFSTYIVAVSSETDKCYSNDYVNVKAHYKNNRGQNLFSGWDKSSSAPGLDRGEYNNSTPHVKGKSWTTCCVLKIRVFLNNQQVNEDNEFVYNNNIYKQYFDITPAEGYSLKTVKAGVYYQNIINANNDGEYEYQVADYCENENNINILEIYLTEDVTSNAQFKVNLFKYNDQNNSDGYNNWPINRASTIKNNNNNDRQDIIYMRTTSQNHDNYAANKFYQDSDGGKTYQGMPDANLSNNGSDNRYGMITFSKYRTPDFFKTTKYDPSKKVFYTDADYITGNEITDDKSKDSVEYIKGYYNVGFPIQLGEDGYYEYDSKNNSATYNDDTHEIDIARQNGGFWLFGTGANKYHFGMHLTTDFNMTEDGQNDGKDCVFEFTGDDDVWVYIDGKLVLDLGGIHGAVGGKINFATGEVTIDSKANASPSRYGNGVKFNLYNECGFQESDIKNNKSHVLQMYYVERGAGESNCKIRFNLPVINEKDVPVDPLSFTKVDAKDNTVPVAGAKFKLVSADGNLIALDEDKNEYAISGADGVVNFRFQKDAEGNITEGVKQGVYLLTEEEAPEGYTKPTSGWTVLVKSDGKGHSIFTISDAIHDSEKGYFITNTKVEKETSVDKTATLVSWENRTYQITLDAEATTTTTTTQVSNAAVDVVLVLDVSGSMDFPKTLTKEKYCKYDELNKNNIYYFIDEDTGWVYALRHVSSGISHWEYKVADDYRNNRGSWSRMWNSKYSGKRDFFTSDGKSRLKDAQEAACNFVDTIAGRNEESRVAVVTFDEDARTLVGLTKLDANGKASLKNAINGLKEPNGGTNQYKGLSQASTLLSAENKEKNAIVVITDGIQENGSANATTVANAQNKATVYAVGMNLSYNETINKKAMALLNDLASQDETGKELAMNIGDEPLGSFLKNIADSINSTNSTGLQSVITDVIDSRFELVDVDGNPTSTVEATYKDDNGQIQKVTGTLSNGSVVWNVPHTNGFRASFYVKAKEDFLGGNVITTNGAESGMRIVGENTFEKFPRPTVNVKPLDFEIADDYEIKFLGDQLDVYNEQMAIEAIVKNIEETSPVEIKNVAITNNNGKYECNIQYSYKDTNDVVGTITGSLTKLTDEQFCDESGKATKVGEPVQVYTLNLSYVPLTVEERANSSVVMPTQSQVAETVSEDGKYSIYVITSDLQLTKYGWDYGTTSELKKLENAVFALYDANGNKVGDDLTTDANGNITFSNLAIGEYYLAEASAPSNYALRNYKFKVVVSKNEDKTYSISVESDNLDTKKVEQRIYTVSAKLSEDENPVVVKEITLNNSKVEAVSTDVINYLVYTLPETGGSGVYVYTIGGVLLMIGAALLLYKNKKNKK